jgi:hypothetical protein
MKGNPTKVTEAVSDISSAFVHAMKKKESKKARIAADWFNFVKQFSMSLEEACYFKHKQDLIYLLVSLERL